MSTKANEKYALGALLVLIVIFFFYRLGSYALIGPDEPRYAQVAREMWQRGDFITPTIGGHLWAEKPVLLYWLMMVSMSLLGVTEWAARLPSALLAAVAVMAVYGTGKRAISPGFGFFSALVLIVNAMFASFAHGASTDMPLSAMMTLGLCSFFLYDAEVGQRKGWLMLAAYGGFGLAVLAKGLVGIVLPAGIIGAYLGLSRRRGNLRRLRLLPGVVLFLAVASTWYAPVIARHGWTFIHEFFISHHFQRFITPRFHHPGPVYYFIPVILVGLFPWTAFLVSALARLRWRQLQSDEPGDRLRWFCAVWIAVPLLFFSLSASKLPGYILPVLPAAALLAAGELQRLFDRGADRALRLSLYMTSALMVVVGVAGVIYARQEIQPGRTGSVLILLAAAGTAAGLLYFSLVKRFRAALAAIVIGSAVSVVLVSHLYLPAVAEKESLRPLARVALRQMRPGERIVGYNYFHHTLTFYTNARSFYDQKGNVVVATSLDELRAKLRQEGSLLCVTRDLFLPPLRRDPHLQVHLIGRQRDIVVVRLTRAKNTG